MRFSALNQRIKVLKEGMDVLHPGYEGKYPLSYRKISSHPSISSKKIYELTDSEATVATEVGQHQIWTTQHYRFVKPRTLCFSGGLGTMGFGLGASLGTNWRPGKRCSTLPATGVSG